MGTLKAFLYAVAVLSASTVYGLDSATPTLTSIWGKPFAPADLVFASKNPKGYRTKALAVVAFSTVCPLAKRLIPKLNKMRAAYQPKGIELVVIFPNAVDDISEIANYALENQLSLPVFKDDPENPWAKEIGIAVTPEVVVLTVDSKSQFHRVYKGAVDAQWAGGGPGTSNTREYLENVLSSIATGSAPSEPDHAASGCRIAPTAVKKAPDESAPPVTYYKDILPILQDRCLQCHRSGEAGAEIFSDFEDYDTVTGLYDTILDRVVQRIMPPWHAIVGDAAHNALVGDLRLSDEQIEKMKQWGASGEFPKGELATAPKPRVWPKKGEWQIGTPDIVLKMPEPYIVPKEKADEYEYFRIKADYKEDRYIQAIEVRPGNRAVVHHIGAIVGPASDADINGNLATLQFYGITGDKVRKIGDYVPGDNFNAHTYPKDFALMLPKGNDIVMEMHYTPTGGEEKPDVSEIGIIWAKEKPKHLLETHVFNRKDVRIPPHVSHYERTNWYQFPTDVKIYALAPHMHYRGKDYILYKVINPGTDKEIREVVLKVPNYDFGWQRTYEFQVPIELRAGEALYGVGHFDNSHFNPHNPDPEEEVKYGLKSHQEMFNLRVKYERVQDLNTISPTPTPATSKLTSDKLN